MYFAISTLINFDTIMCVIDILLTNLISSSCALVLYVYFIFIMYQSLTRKVS